MTTHVRLPLPKQKGGPQTTKKGAKGYNRKRNKARLQKQIRSDSNRNGFSFVKPPPPCLA